VLVADDNTLVRELFVSGLRAQGADCESVEDGLAAVERGSNEGFDVIVIDVSMPWLDGVEATRRLRVQAPAALRIVGVSAHASAADRAEAMAAGMDAFLVKPVMLADLVQAVSAGGAPNVRTGTGQLPTLEHLRVLFAREARQIRVGIHEAAKAGDVQRLRVRIHYLKNSADVARYDAISLRCAQLEAILSAGGDPAERLILEIDRDLAPLCEPT
jgi:CheY-like chemotaxis protein